MVTLCIATDEGLQGSNVLHSVHVHNCALMLQSICSEFHEHSKNEYVYYYILSEPLAVVHS